MDTKKLFIFSYKLYNLICIYIILIKIILNFYSRIETSKLKNHDIIFDFFSNNFIINQNHKLVYS